MTNIIVGPLVTVEQLEIIGGELVANKGQPNGYAPLGPDTKIDISYIPASLIGAVKFKGFWNATTNVISSSDLTINGDPMPAAASGNDGWYFIVTVAGTTNIDGNNDWKIPDVIISNGSTWSKIDNSDMVVSVNGVTPVNGDITLTTNNISENTNLYFTNERVDDRVASLIQNGTGITWTYDDNLNTLTGNVSVTGYTDEMAQDAVGGILTNTTEINLAYNDALNTISATINNGSIDESKLDASTNASLDLADTAAQLAFMTIAVSGQSDIVAETSTDTLTVVAGTNISVTTNATTDTVTINNTVQRGSFTVFSTTDSTPAASLAVGSIGNLSAAPTAASGSGSVVTVTNSTAKIEVTVATAGFFTIQCRGAYGAASTSPNYAFQFYYNNVANLLEMPATTLSSTVNPMGAVGAGAIGAGQAVELRWRQSTGTGQRTTPFAPIIFDWVWSPS